MILSDSRDSVGGGSGVILARVYTRIVRVANYPVLGVLKNNY